MAKQSKKQALTPVVSAVNGVTAPGNAPTLFTVVAPKRPLTGLKYGANGNAATHAALATAAAANGGQLTAVQAMAVCTAQNHKGFYSYAVNRLRILQPVVAA
jgi:hypothetical protein